MTTYPDDVVEKALVEWFRDAPEVLADMTPEYRAQMMKDMRRALAAAEAAMWRPIETAPIAKKVQVWSGTWRSAFPGMYTGNGMWVIVDTCEPEAKGWETVATHWRHLPTPPAASTGRG